MIYIGGQPCHIHVNDICIWVVMECSSLIDEISETANACQKRRQTKNKRMEWTMLRHDKRVKRPTPFNAPKNQGRS